MENSELFYLMALSSVEGIGDISARRLLKACGSAKNIFQLNADQLKELSGIGPVLCKNFHDPVIFHRAEAELKFIDQNQVKVTSYYDPDYPEKLKHCVDAPLILFSRGRFQFNERRVVSIVGTRKMTGYGQGFIREFIAEIKKYDPVIVSGMAYGVDILAHQESLRQSLSTVGVLAHGIDRLYPKPHQSVADKMVINGGLITEFWSNTVPEKENFVKRNRIIAGISEATIVVESAVKGGALITAEMANSYFRDVFAVPGRTTDPMSIGCNNLIRANKAALLNSVRDLEYMLGWKPLAQSRKTLQTELFVELSPEEKKIYDYLLLIDNQVLDFLAIDCQLNIQKALMILLELEFKGLVKSLPGKRYKVIK